MMKPTFDVELARTLRAEGKTYSAIGAMFGVSHTTVACHLDAGLRARRRARTAADAQAAKSGNIVKYANGATATDFMARLAEIPRDTRTRSQILMGDPIYQRSALAQRAQK